MKTMKAIRLAAAHNLLAFSRDWKTDRYSIDSIVAFDPAINHLLATNGSIAIAVPIAEREPFHVGEQALADKPFPELATIKEFSPDWSPNVRFGLGVRNLQAIVDYALAKDVDTIVFGLQADACTGEGEQLDSGIAFAVGNARGVVLPRWGDCSYLDAGVPFTVDRKSVV